MATSRPGISPYFSVTNGAQAMKWYEEALGAKTLVAMKASDGKIVHAEMRIGGGSFMLSDEFPDFQAFSPLHYKGTTAKFILYSKDCDKALDRATKAGAIVLMPAADQFWGERTCKVRDPFGHEWCFSQTLKTMTQADLDKAWADIEKAMASHPKPNEAKKAPAISPKKTAKKAPVKKPVAKKAPAKKLVVKKASAKKAAPKKAAAAKKKK